jgi:hypothetical protein
MDFYLAALLAGVVVMGICAGYAANRLRSALSPAERDYCAGRMLACLAFLVALLSDVLLQLLDASRLPWRIAPLGFAVLGIVLLFRVKRLRQAVSEDGSQRS